jgi:hypothetical protein
MRTFPLAVLLYALLATGGARAQDADEDRAAAQRDFAEGKRAFEAKDYRHAAEAFESAYKRKPHHAPLWNAARAWARAGENVRAANLYTRFLKEAPPDSKDRNTAQAALAELAPKLGRLEIHSAGLTDVAIDGVPLQDSSVYVTPGSHLVEAKHEGKPAPQPRVTVEAGQTMSVTLVVPSAKVEPPPPPPPKPEIPDTAPSGPGWSPTVFYVAAGLTVIAGGVAIWSGIDTLNERSAFDQNPTQDSLDRGKDKQLRTNVLIGVTAGLGLFSTISALWLVDWKGNDRSVKVGMSFAGPGGPTPGLTARGTFP